jgi:hypothetical protein
MADRNDLPLYEPKPTTKTPNKVADSATTTLPKAVASRNARPGALAARADGPGAPDIQFDIRKIFPEVWLFDTLNFNAQ